MYIQGLYYMYIYILCIYYKWITATDSHWKWNITTDLSGVTAAGFEDPP